MGLKEAKEDYVVKKATELFLKKSIEEVTIKDLSDAAGMGEATIYRYFGKKQSVVKKSAIRLQNKVYKDYFKLKGESGYEKIKAFYVGYLKIFISHVEYYKFIREFDAYMMGEKQEDMEEYSAGLDMFIKEFLQAYKEGIKDGSIKENADVETFYYSTTHALLELCKKLSGKAIVRQDENYKKDKEIQKLIDIILYSIKA